MQNQSNPDLKKRHAIDYIHALTRVFACLKEQGFDYIETPEYQYLGKLVREAIDRERELTGLTGAPIITIELLRESADEALIEGFFNLGLNIV